MDPKVARIRVREQGHYLTLAEITEVEELIVPLCEDAQRVFDEGHYDQEPADGGKVATERKNRVLVHASNPLF